MCDIKSACNRDALSLAATTCFALAVAHGLRVIQMRVSILCSGALLAGTFQQSTRFGSLLDRAGESRFALIFPP